MDVDGGGVDIAEVRIAITSDGSEGSCKSSVAGDQGLAATRRSFEGRTTVRQLQAAFTHPRPGRTRRCLSSCSYDGSRDIQVAGGGLGGIGGYLPWLSEVARSK